MISLTLASLALQVQDTLHTDVTQGAADSTPGQFVRAPGFLFFTTQVQDPFLPISDATPHASSGMPGVFETLPSADKVFFPFVVGGRVLYQSDCNLFPCGSFFSTSGATSATETISVPFASEILSFYEPVEFAGAWVYGNRYNDEAGGLWRTQGTSATTERVSVPVTVSGPAGTFAVELQAYQQLVAGDRLFVNDINGLPMRFLVSLGPDLNDPIVEFTTDDLTQSVSLAGAASGRALFTVRQSDSSVELFSIASGSGNPVLHGVLRPSVTSGFQELWRIGPNVEGGQLFLSERADGSQRLVVVDGQTPGWVELIDFTGYQVLSDTNPISRAADGAAALLAGRAGQPAELWFSDGTLAGTAVAGVLPFEFSDRRGEIGAPFADRRVLVSGIEPDGNGRLWMGTPSGLSLLAEPRAPGEPFETYPSADMTTFDGQLFFRAWTASAGQELHALPLSQTGGSTAARVYGGCAATTAEIPRIDSTGGLSLGASAGFRLSGAAPSSAALWFFGTNQGEVGDYGLCSAALGSPIFGSTLAVDAGGVAEWSVTVPAVAGLLDLPFRLQAFVLDSAGPFLGIGSLSDALEITFAP